MIRFERVSFAYPGAERPVMRDVDLEVDEGELALVVGPTGSGKSTLLRAVNGLVPRFSGGLLTGTVSVDGRTTEHHAPRELADLVGYVGQDPAASFVTDTVEEELAYVMTNLGLAPEVMRRRVEDALDLLGLHEVRQRALRTLSGGQQQRVAIGAALTAHPRVLVLDEPTSALDPAAAEDVLAALTRLVHDLGMTVLVAEHRLERVLQHADRLVEVPGHGAPVRSGPPAQLAVAIPSVPPVVELGRLAGWDPLPLSVRDARRRAPELRVRLAAATPPVGPGGEEGELVASVRGRSVAYGSVVALRDVALDVRVGEVLAVMGRNGSGKSTLLAQLAGLPPAGRTRPVVSGTVQVLGDDPSALAPNQVVRRVGFVPQDPGLLLGESTVAAECRAGDRDGALAAGTTDRLLSALIDDLDREAHPRDLSEGQRLAVALAVVLAPTPPLLLLDEPTRGLDYGAKARLVELLAETAAAGHAVVLSTHDVEVVARVADRVVVLAEGEVVADGPAREVVCHSPVFAPQVAKVLAPAPWLTVDEVAAALDPRAATR